MSGTERPVVRRPPEVLQTSAADCGPAALAALLGAHGLSADVGALRDVCATDVDGTSIDDLCDVAYRLGLDAERVVVPLAQVLAAPDRYLPALLLVRTPDGLAHPVCAWRVRGGRVDLVDPAVGRRRVAVADLLDEVFTHEVLMPIPVWASYALSEDATEPFAVRLRAAGTDTVEARYRIRGAVDDGPVTGVGGLFAELDGEDAPPVVQEVPGTGDVRVRGAVLVRAVSRRVGHQPPEALAGVLPCLSGDPASSPAPLRTLWTYAARYPGRLAAAAVAVVGTAAGAVAEVVLGRDLLRDVSGTGLLALAAVVAATMLSGTALAAVVASHGRRVEADVLTALLARLPRLGDAYASTRPAGDLAERAHALRLVREGTELTALGAQRGTTTVVLAAAVVVLAPAAWPVAAALAVLAAVVPGATMRLLREADLRTRSSGGVLTQLAADLIGGLAAVRAHRGGPVVPAWQADLLAGWTRSARRLGRLRAGASVLALAPALLLAAGAAGLAAAGGSDIATVLAVSALAFVAAGATGDLAVSAERLTSLRSVLARLLEPLHAPVVDPEPIEAPDRPGGVAITMRRVEVRRAGTVVLEDVGLDIVAGEHVAVVGPSGAGKSTLLAVLCGWLPASRGTVRADGAVLDGDRLAELRAALAWSDPSARLRDVTAEENVRDGGAQDPVGLLADVGFGGDLAEPVGEAGGRLDVCDAQRLRLARALGRPSARLVVLDDALRGLPRGERADLLALCRRVWATATVVYVTHDPDEADGFDRVVVVDDGRVVESGSPGELSWRPDGAFSQMRGLHEGLRARIARRGTSVSPVLRLVGTTEPIPGTGPAADTVLSRTGWARPPRPPWTVVLDLRNAGLLTVALLAAVVCTTSVVAAAGALHGGVVAGAGWLLPVLALLAGSVVARAAGHVTGAELGVRTGHRLRRGVVTGLLDDDRRRHAGAGTGTRLGRLLDLEILERAVRDTGSTLVVGVVQVVAAVMVAGPGALAAVLLAGLTVCVPFAGVQARRARRVARVRRRVSAAVVDIVLGYRTGTVYPRPPDTALTGSLRAAERAEDRTRTVVTAVLPRTVAVAALCTLALDPPSDGAAALGTVLLALVGFERLARALADLAPARAAWLGARHLLEPVPSGPAVAARRQVTEPSGDVLFQQPVFGNALLGAGHWPPTGTDLDRLEARLAELGLDDVVARMPGGLGQALGAGGWRLSEGERARFCLLRARLGDPDAVDPDAVDPEQVLDSLDPATVHRILDATAPRYRGARLRSGG